MDYSCTSGIEWNNLSKNVRWKLDILGISPTPCQWMFSDVHLTIDITVYLIAMDAIARCHTRPARKYKTQGALVAECALRAN